MGKFIDLTGKYFGRLKVIERAENEKYGRSMWKCQCKCGKITVVTGDNLRRKHTESCGCLWTDTIIKSNTKHGLGETRLYGIWNDMRRRCYDNSRKAYKDYGGRRIKVCDEWIDKENGFINFYNWSVNNGYVEPLTLNRKDNNGNYEPSNCRWVTMTVQANNTRANRIIFFDGKSMTMKQWSVYIGVDYHTLTSRIYRNIPIEKALTAPNQNFVKRTDRWK
jgi:hypothetical protein